MYQKSTASPRSIPNPEAVALEAINLLHAMGPWPPMTKKQIYGSSRCFFCNLQPRKPQVGFDPKTGKRIPLHLPLHYTDEAGQSACPGEQIRDYLRALDDGTSSLPSTEKDVRHFLTALATMRFWPLHREFSVGNGRIRQDPICHWCGMPKWEHTATCPNSQLAQLVLTYATDGWKYRRRPQLTINPERLPLDPRPHKPRRRPQNPPVAKPPKKKPKWLS